MRAFLKSSFVWQFAGGFLLGAVGLLTLQPGERSPAMPGYTSIAQR